MIKLTEKKRAKIVIRFLLSFWLAVDKFGSQLRIGRYLSYLNAR